MYNHIVPILVVTNTVVEEAQYKLSPANSATMARRTHFRKAILASSSGLIWTLAMDFVQRCLAYIDKNADDLLKSDEFLQIGQNLLCEIFERDELQISGEILIWKAALRWADAKCRENGIECSAKNRRAMLGPAMFQNSLSALLTRGFFEKN
ncbi:hypothetical protein niasHT_022173 [Heterodera trifolii]|uniref:BACK domain-containing protein n=1 Tax=Heterodera trifolii TaxID=157864 RepID=A0ABD2KPG4_9BILA